MSSTRWQEAVNAFMVNLAISIATVTGALCLFMGWRSGSVVGAVLLLYGSWGPSGS